MGSNTCPIKLKAKTKIVTWTSETRKKETDEGKPGKCETEKEIEKGIPESDAEKGNPEKAK